MNDADRGDGPAIDQAVIDQALIVKPGDTLIVRVDPEHCPDAQVLDEVKRELEKHLPHVKALVVACHELGVYRP